MSIRNIQTVKKNSMSPTIEIKDDDDALIDLSLPYSPEGNVAASAPSPSLISDTPLTYENREGVKLFYSENAFSKDESITSCKNCGRYMMMFNNGPCIVPCGHTFCYVCVKTTEIHCEICNKNFKLDGENYIENKSYKDLFEMYAEQGQDCNIDSVYQESRGLINQRLKEISTYLPQWKEQTRKAMRMQMTLGFWTHEMDLQENLAEGETYAPIIMKTMECVSRIMVKVDSLIKYQSKEWKKEIAKHRTKSTPLELLFTKDLDVNKALVEKTIYIRSFFGNKLYYYKLSPGYGFVHIHSGQERNPTEIDEKTEIIECFNILYKNREVFFEFSIEREGIAYVKKVFFKLESSEDNILEYVHKVTLLFLGLYHSLKGSMVNRKGKEIIIPDANRYDSVFNIPSSYKQDFLTDRKRNRGDVILRKTPVTELVILTCDTPYIKGSNYLIGKVSSGLSVLENSLTNDTSGVIQDCGITMPSSTF